jgi:hypothetical protein
MREKGKRGSLPFVLFERENPLDIPLSSASRLLRGDLSELDVLGELLASDDAREGLHLALV